MPPSELRSGKLGEQIDDRPFIGIGLDPGGWELGLGRRESVVPEDLDEGPIIEQDIIRISHRDSVNDLVRRGRDLERIVLAKAVNYHAEHRILVNGKKTVVFQ